MGHAIITRRGGGGIKTVEGTKSSATTGILTVTGVGFQPSIVSITPNGDYGALANSSLSVVTGGSGTSYVNDATINTTINSDGFVTKFPFTGIAKSFTYKCYE